MTIFLLKRSINPHEFNHLFISRRYKMSIFSDISSDISRVYSKFIDNFWINFLALFISLFSGYLTYCIFPYLVNFILNLLPSPQVFISIVACLSPAEIEKLSCLFIYLVVYFPIIMFIIVWGLFVCIFSKCIDSIISYLSKLR